MAPLQLHDVDDAERLCAAIVAKSRLELSWHDREDAVQYLLGECWRISVSFNPSGIRFSTYAYQTLSRRRIDWQRSRFGRTKWQFADRTYERPHVDLVSLDDPERDRLGATIATGPSDPAADSDADLVGLLRERDRERLGDYAELGVRPSRRAPW
jgi:DNA-directed RNA polymerase specialized sigma24 family protein